MQIPSILIMLGLVSLIASALALGTAMFYGKRSIQLDRASRDLEALRELGER